MGDLADDFAAMKAPKREYRVTWQRNTGHEQQSRLYQREKSARKLFDELPADILMKRYQSRTVGEWEAHCATPSCGNLTAPLGDYCMECLAVVINREIENA